MRGRDETALVVVIAAVALWGFATSQAFEDTPLGDRVPRTASINGVEPPPAIALDGYCLGLTRDEINRRRASAGHREPLQTYPLEARGRVAGYTVLNWHETGYDHPRHGTLDAANRLCYVAGDKLELQRGDWHAVLSAGGSLAEIEKALGAGSWVPKMGCGNAQDIMQWRIQPNAYVQAIIDEERTVFFSISTRPQKWSVL